jgi:hypothetical protein
LFATCLWVASACAIAADEWIYTVREGDTLWTLTQRFLTHQNLLPRLQAHNNVTRPRRLPPGTQLRIPYEWIRSDPTPARVVAVRGEVRAQGGSGAARRVQAQDLVQPGEVLTTPADGHALLEFQDGSRLALLADSMLRVAVARTYATGTSETRLELLRGRTENRVVPRGSQGVRFEIFTPAGITSVRGTDYRVSAEGSEKARAEVLEGAVAVDGTGGGVTVPAGFGSVVQAGAAPSEPVQLLPAPDLSALPARVPALPAELALPPLPGARAYRVQLARDAGFESIVLDVLEPDARLRLPMLPSGAYAVRVRGVDAAGLEGLNAQGALELDAAPPPPRAVSPEPGQAVSGDSIALHFAASPGLTHRIQVARDPAFSGLVRDVTDVATSPYRVDGDLAAGIYHWRVAARHPEHGEGPFGPARSFRRSPSAPAAVAFALAPDTLRLGWESAEPQARFRVQLARDETFSEVVLDRLVEGRELTAPRPEPGTYHARVRAVGSDGFEGPYSDLPGVSVPPPPAAPALIEPAEAGVMAAAPIVLRWQARVDERYDVRVERDDGSAAPVYERAGVSGGEVTLEHSLLPGRYAWRVAASTAQDGRGGFSPARRLHVPPAVPVLDAPAVTAGSVQLSWHTEVPAAAYRVQVARDAQFADLVADERVSGVQWSVAGLPPGQYHARVQGLNDDGIGGTFSLGRAVDVPRSFPWWLLPVLPLLLLLP